MTPLTVETLDLQNNMQKIKSKIQIQFPII